LISPKALPLTQVVSQDPPATGIVMHVTRTGEVTVKVEVVNSMGVRA
jgi:hypothetical protein